VAPKETWIKKCGEHGTRRAAEGERWKQQQNTELMKKSEAPRTTSHKSIPSVILLACMVKKFPLRTCGIFSQNG